MLVDVVADQEVGAEHARRAAHDLEDLGMGSEPLLRSRLADAPGVILSAVSRLDAMQSRSRLEGRGISTRLVPVPVPSPGRRPGRVTPGQERGPGGLGWLWFLIGLAALAGLLALVRAVIDGRPAPDLRPRRSKVLQAARDAVVTVRRDTPSDADLERVEGFVVDGDLVVTGARLAATRGDRLLIDGTAPATVVSVDEWLGVSVAQLAENADHSLELGDATGLRTEQIVLVPGTTAGQAKVVTPAIPRMGLALIQLDLAHVATSDGGPVLDDTGEVIAVIVGAAPGGGALALPVNYLGMDPDPLLSAHHDALVSERWKRWLAAADLPTRRRAQDLIAEIERPYLLEAICHHGGRVIAHVGVLSPDRPASGRLSFQLEGRGPRPRTRQPPVPRWQSVSFGRAGVAPPREVRWLQRYGHRLTHYTAEVTMRFTGSWGGPVGGELILNHGREGSDRVTVTAAVSRPRLSLESRRFLDRRPEPTQTPITW